MKPKRQKMTPRPSFKVLGQLTIGVTRVECFQILAAGNGATAWDASVALLVDTMGVHAYIVPAVNWAYQFADFEMLTEDEFRARYAPERKTIVGGVEVDDES